ncbi:MAG: hypothetical protein M1836_006516 [Candelina mexicana]|nr:MAG: hypothetical protein M1836_006516 [Candelina mexicana]
MDQPDQSSPKKQNPMDIIMSGLAENSVTKIQQGLDLFSTKSRGLDSDTLDRVLNLAVTQAKPNIVRYLLDETKCTVEGLSPWYVGRAAGAIDGYGEEELGYRLRDVIAVLDILVERGWDINRGPRNPDPSNPDYLIYKVCGSEKLIRWCLDNGAHVAYPDVEWLTPPLVSVTIFGNISSVELLLSRGAQFGRRTLHMACLSAASAGPERWGERMEMVRYLVEEKGCDVNGMDMPEGETYGNHYGTPLNYLAHRTAPGNRTAEEIARYLLEKGANPEIKDGYGISDAFGYAKRNKNILDILNDWKKQKENEST